MDKKTIQAIEEILKRGHDAKIRRNRKGEGYVVVELWETVKYRPSADGGGGEGQ